MIVVLSHNSTIKNNEAVRAKGRRLRRMSRSRACQPAQKCRLQLMVTN